MKTSLPRHSSPRSLAGIALFSAGLAVSMGAQATTYLEAKGELAALIGGLSGGYKQTLTPVVSPINAAGNDTVEFTAPSFTGSGPDLYGKASASSSASFGALVERSSALAQFYGAIAYAGLGQSTAFAQDLIVIHGSGTIGLTLHSQLSGATSNGDPGGVNVRTETDISPNGRTDNSQLISLKEAYGSNAQFGSLLSGTIDVHDGEAFNISASLNQITSVRADSSSAVTATTFASLGYWVSLSPGATLTSESGWNYLAPTSPVPEPMSAALLAGGLLALTLRRRCR
jgi:hypothetical protein